MEVPLNEENVRRVVLAAFQGVNPGAFYLRLAMREAEKIREEVIAEFVATMERDYAHELTGEES